LSQVVVAGLLVAVVRAVYWQVLLLSLLALLTQLPLVAVALLEQEVRLTELTV
jgi:hypothetical protein